MKNHPVSDSVYCLHADVRNNELFEGIWPIPDGVSLNSYLVRGEKTALIDLFRDWSGAAAQVGGELAALGLEWGNVDYLILNHLEPDHTGWLREFRERCPRAKILATPKGIELVKKFYKIEDGLAAVKEGDTLDLGKGMVLSFYETPNVHWPETMMTWEPRSGCLFSCDAFGSYGALGDRVFDDEFNEEEHVFFEKEGLRYYANIVSSFSAFVEKAIRKLAALDIRCIAPSHGIVWRKNPGTILKRYAAYASYAAAGEAGITVIWGSMYGNTKAGVDAVVRGIEAEGVPYTLHRVPNEDVSYILADVYKFAGLVIAMPTYEYAVFPPMAYVLDILRRKHIGNKRALRIGSWGWVGGAKKEYDSIISNFKWSRIESVEWQGYPGPEDFALLEARGRELARAVKSPPEQG
ncbi:MAG: FprA family A-type flavoprotein [Treponema sp.]|jgi:flavorubredoxin|nr:FprA family A-type flavoprotein [Treponema sp.]